MTDLVAVSYPQPPAIPGASTIIAVAEAITIEDQATYEIANETLRSVKAGIAAVKAEEDKIVPPLFAAHKAAKALFNKLYAPFTTAEGIIKPKMLAFVTAQEKARREAQAAADAAAKAERDRLAAEAAKAEKKGDAVGAAALSATASVITAPVVAAAFEQAKGAIVVKKWKGRVIDKGVFVAFVAEHQDYLHLLDVNESALNKLAAAMKENLHVGGVEAYEEASLTSRKAAVEEQF